MRYVTNFYFLYPQEAEQPHQPRPTAGSSVRRRYYPDSHHKGQSPSAVETVPIDELEPSHQRPFRPAATGEELLQEAEEAAGEPILQVVNAKGLKKLVANLERKVSLYLLRSYLTILLMSMRLLAFNYYYCLDDEVILVYISRRHEYSSCGPVHS